MRGRGAVSSLRAALWTLGRLGEIRRKLRSQQVDQVRLQPPPPLPDAAIGGVVRVLGRRRASCLEKAFILQSWHAAHGRPHDLVIGVKGQSASFLAHAWLAGHEACNHGQFQEMIRLPPR